jgi:hypothetical protein
MGNWGCVAVHTCCSTGDGGRARSSGLRGVKGGELRQHDAGRGGSGDAAAADGESESWGRVEVTAGARRRRASRPHGGTAGRGSQVCGIRVLAARGWPPAE